VIFASYAEMRVIVRKTPKPHRNPLKDKTMSTTHRRIVSSSRRPPSSNRTSATISRPVAAAPGSNAKQIQPSKPVTTGGNAKQTQPTTTAPPKNTRPSSGANAKPAPRPAKTLSEKQIRRAEERRAQARRQERWERLKPVWITLGLVVVAILFFISLAGGPSGSGNSSVGQVAPPAVANAVTGVSQQTFAAVGTGGIQNPPTSGTNAAILKDANGKPEIVYIGAEYCPYCAAERWSLIVALSRFGTFQNLHLTTSSSTDVFANTPTFTFVGSTYTSQYLNFSPVETADREQNPLQTPTAQQQQLLSTYGNNGAIPFTDIANRYVTSGAGFSPQILDGLTWQEIASDLSNPQNTVTQQIVGNANYLTAAICQVTGGQPASVCQAAPIPTITQKLSH
jgi:thiol-disulfide isomerase/thioredoxin